MLLKHFDKKNANEYGLSMIELLVVIVIIGILAATAIGVTLNQRKKANDSAVESDVRNTVMSIETALVDYPNNQVEDVLAGVDEETITIELQGVEALNPERVVHLSTGVAVHIENQGSLAYTVKGWHKNGSKYVEETPFTYDSATGTFGNTEGTGGEEGNSGDEENNDPFAANVAAVEADVNKVANTIHTAMEQNPGFVVSQYQHEPSGGTLDIILVNEESYGDESIHITTIELSEGVTVNYSGAYTGMTSIGFDVNGKHQDGTGETGDLYQYYYMTDEAREMFPEEEHPPNGYEWWSQ